MCRRYALDQLESAVDAEQTHTRDGGNFTLPPVRVEGLRFVLYDGGHQSGV